MGDKSFKTIYGAPVKHLSLVMLVVQNSALALSMRYSRTMPGPKYLITTAVVISELMKLTLSFIMYLHEIYTRSQHPVLPNLSNNSSSQASKYSVHELFYDTFGVKSGFLKVMVPAVFFTLQNNLQFVAASNLDAATFQVTYQGKLLTTAFFATTMLRQTVTAKQWISLLIITAGVACVQLPAGNAQIYQDGNYFIGLIAVGVACVCSGFAGVYFEKILKACIMSLWVRNLQLGVGCIAIAVIGTAAWDGTTIARDGFFQGYSPIVWLTLIIQAAGGLIVALVVKYADNILKGFATSISIIISAAASELLFDHTVTPYFAIGACMVILATYLYGKYSPEKHLATTVTSEEEVSTLLAND